MSEEKGSNDDELHDVIAVSGGPGGGMPHMG